MLCQLFVRVSNQHKSLCYFGHSAHFILTIYCCISFLFLINVNSVNTVKVNSISIFKSINICYLPAGRSVLGKTVPEVLSTARGHITEPIRFKDLGFRTTEMLQKKIKLIYHTCFILHASLNTRLADLNFTF